MKQNLEQTHGLIYSQPLLLMLIQKGLSREEAYRLVQDEAMACWKSGEDFQDRVKKNKRIGEILASEEIKKCFDLDNQLRNVDIIFRRLNLRKK
jgi:adenylosuccinate lyase